MVIFPAGGGNNGMVSRMGSRTSKDCSIEQKVSGMGQTVERRVRIKATCRYRQAHSHIRILVDETVVLEGQKHRVQR